MPKKSTKYRTVRGVEYRTIVAAAEELEVAKSTLERYIRNGFVERPPRIITGQTSMRYFPDDWMEQTKSKLNGGN